MPSRSATSPSMPECPTLRTVVSMSTAAEESTFPVRGSSSWPALSTLSGAGDWATSRPADEKERNVAARSIRNLRIPLSSIFSAMALHGVQQLRGVIADAVLEDDLDVFDVPDATRRIALDPRRPRWR